MFLVSRRLNHCSATNQKVTFWPKETGIRYGDTISGKAIFTSGRLFCLLLFSARELVWWPHGGFLFHLLYYYIERSWTFGRRGQCHQLFVTFLYHAFWFHEKNCQDDFCLWYKIPNNNCIQFISRHIKAFIVVFLWKFSQLNLAFKDFLLFLLSIDILPPLIF